jgi:hypothetical protein
LADLSTIKRAGVPILRSLNIRFQLKQPTLRLRQVQSDSRHYFLR